MRLTILLCLLLFSCSPNPLTDVQIKMVKESCEKRGGVIEIFNTPLVSRVDCEELPE